MKFETIILSKDAGIVTVILNRPQVLNALNHKMVEELNIVLDKAERDEETKVLVITGTGRGFCSGADLSTLTPTDISVVQRREAVLRWGKLACRLIELEMPVVAAVNGVAAGGGCNLALAADIIIASENAVFYEVFPRRGLMPDMAGTYTLPRLVGVSKAKELCFTGDAIGAKEAERIGLVNKVVPAAKLESTVKEFARRLAKGPSKALGLTKTAINRSLTVDLSAACEYEAEGQAILFQTDDFKEGTQAFLEKREPKFKGR